MRLMDMQSNPQGLLRIALAAQRVGLSSDAFATACKRGDIPVELLRIGPRGFRYVRARELAAFLNGRNLDLF